MVGGKCKVSFDVPNSIASVLGFKQNIVYGVGRHASENLVNSILVHCNIIHSSCVAHNLPPSDCRRHFSVFDRSTRRALGFTWRGIDYTFLSS